MHLHDKQCFERGAPAPQYRAFLDWWSPGSPKPLIDTTDPAVAQALARCLTSRLKLKQTLAGLVPMPSKAFHPRECNWCVYPDAQLREAVGYAAWVSKYNLITSEYENPKWQAFFAGAISTSRLSDDEWREAHTRRADAIYHAQYGMDQ